LTTSEAVKPIGYQGHSLLASEVKVTMFLCVLLSAYNTAAISGQYLAN